MSIDDQKNWIFFAGPRITKEVLKPPCKYFLLHPVVWLASCYSTRGCSGALSISCGFMRFLKKINKGRNKVITCKHADLHGYQCATLGWRQHAYLSSLFQYVNSRLSFGDCCSSCSVAVEYSGWRKLDRSPQQIKEFGYTVFVKLPCTSSRCWFWRSQRKCGVPFDKLMKPVVSHTVRSLVEHMYKFIVFRERIRKSPDQTAAQTKKQSLHFNDVFVEFFL